MTTPSAAAAAATTATATAAAASTPLQLPEIDFHGYRFGNAEQRAAVCSQIAAACSTYGFFYLAHHGVSSEAIGSAFKAAQSFFAQPVEKRLACRSRYNNQNRGYQPLLDTQHPGKPPDVKESFDMGFPLADDDADMLAGLPFHAPNSWPDETEDLDKNLSGFRGATENLYFSMLETGRDVLRAMAEALQADRNFFVKHCTKPSTNMRLVHYPPQPPDLEEGIGSTAHTDKGLITLLLNDDNEGLQVEFSDGRWIDAPPRGDALIVNVGQLMTRWTNGRFRSAVHRVINTTGRERYSIPQFHHPDYRAVVDPRGLMLGSGEVKFEPVVAGEFVAAGFSRDRKSWATATV